MGSRLTRIATKNGDAGLTSLGDGSRVEKNSPRVEVLGTIDELNSWIGAVVALCEDIDVRRDLSAVQNSLFDLGAGVSLPSSQILTKAHVEEVETIFERLHARLPAQREFVLPGGTSAAAFAHIARSVCRRAEREFLSLQEVDPQPATDALAFLNRLSDVLFELARAINLSLGVSEIQWAPKPKT